MGRTEMLAYPYGWGEERVLSASSAAPQFPEVMRCAFGFERPPPELDD